MICRQSIATLICLWVLCGCASTPRVKKPYVPHPDQRVWVDEAAVINLVTRLVYDAQFESRRHRAEERYAALLRYWYHRTSQNGLDQDAGVRALNYIRKIHADAGGTRKLWKHVLELAREPVAGQKGMPVPEDFR